MKKFITFALTGALSFGLLTGCSKNETATDEKGETSATPTTQASNDKETTTDTVYEPITVTHSYGTVTIEELPSRVVVFDMGTLDTMDALDVDAEFALPTGNVPSYLSEYENATSVGSIKEPDIEAIYEFAPDVIFISGRQADYYEELSSVAPTIYIDLDVTNYMEDFTRNVTTLGQIFNKTQEAEAALSQIAETVATGQEIVNASDKKAMILLTNDGNISVYGPGSRFGLIHDLMGVLPADNTIEVSTHGQEASYEYIAEINPDIIYVVDRTAVVAGSTDAASVLDNELVNSTTAAKEGKIINLDADMWYLSGGGIVSVSQMILDTTSAFN